MTSRERAEAWWDEHLVFCADEGAEAIDTVISLLDAHAAEAHKTGYETGYADAISTRGTSSRVVAEREACARMLRCRLTGHPCGTDTVPAGMPPDCDMCKAAAAIRARSQT